MVNFPRQQEDFVTLSERERAVLQCIARALSSQQCAQQLGIAPRAVERHVENLRNKLNAKRKPHLVAKALAGGPLYVRILLRRSFAMRQRAAAASEQACA